MKAGDEYEVIRDATHGDWKTALVRPDEWPVLKAGTRVKLVKMWANFYGNQMKVKAPNGQIYDLEPHYLMEVKTKVRK